MEINGAKSSTDCVWSMWLAGTRQRARQAAANNWISAAKHSVRNINWTVYRVRWPVMNNSIATVDSAEKPRWSYTGIKSGLLNIFFSLVKHLLWKLNQTQPTTIYLDISVSIRGLHQKKMKLILLPVLATVVMWRGKKSVARDKICLSLKV